MVDRYIPTSEALVYSIMIIEVKHMESDVLWAEKAYHFEKVI
jgi:hypothetical protein